MVEEMAALQSTGTWDLVPLPVDKSPVGCRWVYTVKKCPDGGVDRLKARLVAKGYTQVFGFDYYGVDCHFIRKKIVSRCMTTSFVNSSNQLADIFTKSLRGPRIQFIYNKLGAYNLYAPA